MSDENTKTEEAAPAPKGSANVSKPAKVETAPAPAPEALAEPEAPAPSIDARRHASAPHFMFDDEFAGQGGVFRIDPNGKRVRVED